MKNREYKTPYNRVKNGTISVGGKTFFARSPWEANIAAYLEALKGMGHIQDWHHEPETFWFEAIRRGVRSYKPDFKIIRPDGTHYFIEVKGWMDAKSATKLKRMKKYHPATKVVLFDSKRYKKIEKTKAIIPNWGLLDNK